MYSIITWNVVITKNVGITLWNTVITQSFLIYATSMPPAGAITAGIEELLSSLLISIKSGPRIPWLYHLSADKQSNRPKGTPVPQSLSLEHSTIFLVPVFNSSFFRLLFCSYLALIPALQSLDAFDIQWLWS